VVERASFLIPCEFLACAFCGTLKDVMAHRFWKNHGQVGFILLVGGLAISFLVVVFLLVWMVIAAPSYVAEHAPLDVLSPVTVTDSISGIAVSTNAELESMLAEVRREQARIATPKTVKGIYLSSGNFGNTAVREELLSMIERTELNTAVVDLKNFGGSVAYDSMVPEVIRLATKQVRITNLAERIYEFHAQGVYMIARIPVFQDSVLAAALPEEAVHFADGSLWRDHAGNAWLDPASQHVWAYNIALAQEAYQLGFDEINFDYIRFISDGPVSLAIYPRWDQGVQTRNDVLREFFASMYDQLHPLGVVTSADFFGMVLLQEDGMSIGQHLADAAPYVDYIAPMVYPSHYPDMFWGYPNPALYPYEIIYGSLKEGTDILEKQSLLAASTTVDGQATIQLSREQLARQFRPWIQDFDLGAVYTPDMIRKELQAAYDAHSSGWVLWNSRNVYTEDALGKQE